MGCTPQDGEESTVSIHGELVAYSPIWEGPQARKGATDSCIRSPVQTSTCRRPARDKATSTGEVNNLRHDVDALNRANIPT